MNPNADTLAAPMTIGAIGGTLSSILVSFKYTDLTQTILLSALGAITSFVVSALMDWTIKKIKQR